MRNADVLRESVAALRGSRMRTVLTGAGITVGTLALLLIVSLSIGLANLVDEFVATEDQLRQVIVLPGFGNSGKRGEVPEVDGAMSEGKRARLRRALLKRSRGGPPIQVGNYAIDAETEAELTNLPQVQSSRPFLQERLEYEFDAVVPPEDAPKTVLSLGVPQTHPHYPGRLLAGRWFESEDERAVVVHEVLLYRLGLTTDEQQAALVGTKMRITARGSRNRSFIDMIASDRLRPSGEVLYEEELPIIGVLKERYGPDPASVVEEAWAMQADLFIPGDYARHLWEKRPGTDGVRALLLVATDLDSIEAIEEAVQERGLQGRSVREVVERVRQTLSVSTYIAAFLAGIAVFVAALGIVNTMVMSVMERTREIGLLKALGARSSDVARLFLVEGALLGLAGGILGALIAYGLGLIGDEMGRTWIENAFQTPFLGTLFPYPPWLAASGLGFAVLTSLLASVVPALRASRVDPVVALRHE